VGPNTLGLPVGMAPHPPVPKATLAPTPRGLLHISLLPLTFVGITLRSPEKTHGLFIFNILRTVYDGNNFALRTNRITDNALGVYQPSEADIIILVTSRPSEDLLAVYDAHQGPNGNYLWRVMGRDGLQAGETPLVTQFEKGFDSVQKHK
jgi:hypothetical protein